MRVMRRPRPDQTCASAALCRRARFLVSLANRSARALLPIPPLHELLEQRIAITLRDRCTGGWRSAEERLELAIDVLLGWHLAAIEALQLLLRRAEPGPALHRRCQVDVLPLRMVRRLQQLVPIGEQPLDEALDLAIALVLLGVIIDRQHAWHRDRVDPAALGDQARIVRAGEVTECIIVGELR